MIFTWLYWWIRGLREAYDIDKSEDETMEEFLYRVLDGWEETWNKRVL